MQKILKITLFSLLFIFALLYFSINTQSGKKFSYNILSFIASQKIGLPTKVLLFDIHSYPYMKANLLIDKKYDLKIDGFYENKKFNLRYTLTSACIASDVCKIKGDVDIKGYIKGPRKQVKITGEGTALDGNITYEAIKHRHSFNDVHIDIQDINASKLFKLLGQKAIFEGAAQGSIDFDIISHEKRKGTILYSVKDHDYHGLEVAFNAKVDVQDEIHTFTMKAQTPTAMLQLYQGEYNKESKKASAHYTLDIQNVTDLKKILKIKYDSPFYAQGKLQYDNKKISMQGLSESLGGKLDLLFTENKLHFYLNDAPLSPLMHKVKINPLFDTNITGSGIYDVRQKTVVFDANLTDITFKKSKLTKSLFKSSEIDLAKEQFDNNHLHLQTIDGETTTTLSLKNKNNHLIFKNTEINTDNHSVASNVDLKMYQYYLKGNLFVKVDKYTSSNDTYVNFDGLMQRYYAVKLNGLVNQKRTSMDYSITAKRFPSHICTIEDDVNVTGHISGAFKRLYIEGNGTALNGTVSYNGVQVSEQFKDVNIHMKNIHALKLSTLLGHPELPIGKVDLDAHFNLLSQKKQKGMLHYTLQKSTLFDLPFTLNTNVEIDNKTQKFTADITLADAKINLSKGIHLGDSNQSEAFYSVNIADLTTLEKLLGYKYKGSFYAVGTVKYNGDYSLHGLTKTFDGLTEFDYNKERLDIDLSKVSLKQVMHLFPYPSMLDAQTTGKIHYDFTQKKLLVKTHLENAKFIYSKEIDTIYKKSGINLLSETFNNSTLNLTHQNKIIVADLILKNDTSHVTLTNANINSKLKRINAYFDVSMQKEEFSGKIYGSLDDPKIDLNMQKLVRHEMDKQLDSFVGEDNRKMMENMPMGGVAKDMASDMGGGFLDMFF